MCQYLVNDTQGRMSAYYIYSAPVSGANGCLQKKKKKRHSTISYKQLTREFTNAV